MTKNMQQPIFDSAKISNDIHRLLSKGDRTAFDELVASGEQAVPALTKLLKEKRADEDVVIPIMAILSHLPPADLPTQALLDILQVIIPNSLFRQDTSESAIRLSAAWVLGKAESESVAVVQAFVDALIDSNSVVSNAALDMLVMLPSVLKAVIARLVKDLSAPKPYTHIAAARILEILPGGYDAIPESKRDTFLELRFDPLPPSVSAYSNTAGVGNSAPDKPRYCFWAVIPEALRWKCR